MTARRALPGGLAAAIAAAAALVLAPTASAATSTAWTGSSTSSKLWSDAANWGGIAPGTAIGNLSFGDLATCDQGLAPAGSACYAGTDNLGAATVNHIQIGGGKEYQLSPASAGADTLTLEGNGANPNVGITAAPSGTNLQLANLAIPIALGAAQQWDVSNNGILYLNKISGAHPLTLHLAHGWVQANDIQTSALTISGPGELQLDQFAGSAEKLPSVTVNDSAGPGSGLGVSANNASSGPITIAGTDNNFIVLTSRAPGETTLDVSGGVTLDATTNVEFDIDGNDTTPGSDFSQLTASGNVAFNGAQISLWQAQDSGNCDPLTPGTSFTVLQAGSLSGQIKVGGRLISAGQSAPEMLQSDNCSGAAKVPVIVSYGAKSLTATIAAAPSAAGQAPQIGGTATVGDRLTLGDNGSWNGIPAPTFRYQWLACASSSNCAPIAGATRRSYTLARAQVGKTVELQVTARNRLGSAQALSNALGPVVARSIRTTPSLRGLIRFELSRLSHPHGRRGLRRLLRVGFYRARFNAPIAGTLRVSWQTTARLGHGRHARRHRYVLARGVAHTRRARSLRITIRLTRVGRRLLREHPLRRRITAREGFHTRRYGWITYTRRFRL